MKRATLMIRPWDYSLEVLAAWLNPTTWLNDELKQFKRAALVGDFIDHILGLNAANWVQETPYLEIGDIQTLWTSWWGVRKACVARDPKLSVVSPFFFVDSPPFFIVVSPFFFVDSPLFFLVVSSLFLSFILEDSLSFL